MLLKRLAEYSARLESRPMLYGEVVVRYIIELNSVGRPLSPEPTDISNPATPRTKRGQHRLMPQIQRSRGVNPILFADKAEYTLGITSGSTKHAARITKCHRAYMSILGRCAERTGLLEVRAVWHFLEGTPLSKLELGEDFDGAAALTFRVNGIFPSDLPAVQRFWAEEHNPANPASREARMMQCIVCGETRPVLSRLQAKIKGIPGSQTSGTAIISANADAFESYGLQASLIAPTCAECGESFTHSINDLLQNEANHLIIGRAVFIFWTRDASDFSFRDFLIAPQSVQVRELIQSVRSDHRNNNFMDNAFYAIALSASGGRVAVRDWIDSTVAKVRSNLARWFKRQSIIASFGEFPCLFGIASLAGSTVRERRDLHPATACAILRAALMGTPLPFGLLYETVRRNRVEKEVTSARAALIKLAICSAPRAAMEDTMVSLDRQDHSPAYLCGRLLAVLERAQRLAIPRIRRNATIVGRFFSIASSAPLSVFPRLLCGTQTHLAKLERDHPGAYVALQRKIEEIITGISAFPSLLTLEEQGFFALGYYHQRAHDRGQAKEKWSMGEAAEVVEASDTGRE